MRLRILAPLLALSISATAQATTLSFNVDTDSVCFGNGTADFAGVVPILGNFAVNTGSCQGIAGLTAAFKENAVFDANAPRPDADDIEGIIRSLIKRHRVGSANRNRITVPGYSSFTDFCNANKTEVMKQAILYNTDIAINEISFDLFSLFHTHRNNPLRNKADQIYLRSTLQGFEKKLQKGRYPLMLMFQHVVMVTGYTETPDGVQLTLQDSNHRFNIDTYSFPYVTLDDGTKAPALSNRMFWDVTPERMMSW